MITTSARHREAVSLDPRNVQSGWVDLSLGDIGVEAPPFEVHDLLTGASYTWNGPRNYLELRPQEVPAHVFLVQRLVSEPGA